MSTSSLRNVSLDPSFEEQTSYVLPRRNRIRDNRPTPNKILKFLDKAAKHLDLKIVLISPQELDVGYNGDGLMKATSYSNAIHEIAHYLCASESRRSRINYGLGRGPDDGPGKQSQPKLSRENSIKEEQQASFLGILMERYLGMEWTETFVEHSWSDPKCGDGPDGMMFTIEQLEKKGLVERDTLKGKRRYVPRINQWVGRQRIW